MALSNLDPVHAALIANGAEGGHEVHPTGIATFVSQQHVAFSHSCNMYICSHPDAGDSVLCTASCEVPAIGPVFAAVYSGSDAAGAPAAHLTIWSAAAATPAEGGHTDASVFFVRSSTTCELPGSGGLCSEEAAEPLLRLCDMPGYPHVAFAVAGSGGVLVAGLGPAGGTKDSIRAMPITADGVDAEALFCEVRCSGTDLLISAASTTAARFIRVFLATGQAQEECGALAWSEALSGGVVLEAVGMHWDARAAAAVVALADGSHTLMSWEHGTDAAGTGAGNAAWRVLQPLPLAAVPRFAAPLLQPANAARSEAAGAAALADGTITLHCGPAGDASSDTVEGLMCSVFVSPFDEEQGGWQLLQVAQGHGGARLVDLTPPTDPEAQLVDAKLASTTSLAVLLQTASGTVQLPAAGDLPRFGRGGGGAAGSSSAPAQQVGAKVEQLDEEVEYTTGAKHEQHVVFQYLPSWLSDKLQQAMQFAPAAQPRAGASAGRGGAGGGTAAAAQHALNTAVDVAAAAVLASSSTRGNVASALATAAATATQALQSAHASQAQLGVGSSVMSARPSARMLHNAREAAAAGSAFPVWAHAAEELLLSKTARLGLLLLLTRDTCGVPQALAWHLACLTAQWELLRQLTASDGGVSSAQQGALQRAMERCVAEWGISQEDMLRAGVSALLMFFAFSDRVRAVLDGVLLNQHRQLHALGTEGGEAAAALLAPLQSLTARAIHAFASAPLFSGVDTQGGCALSALRPWLAAKWPVAEVCALATHALKRTVTAQDADASTVAQGVLATHQSICLGSFVVKALPSSAPQLQALLAAAGAALSAANSANGVGAVLSALQAPDSAAVDALPGLLSACATHEALPEQVALLLSACSRFAAARGSPDLAAELLMAVAQVEWAAGGATKPPRLAHLLGVHIAQSTAPSAPSDMLHGVLQCVAQQAQGSALDRVGAWCVHAMWALMEGGEGGLPERLLDAASGDSDGTAVVGEGVPAVHISGDAVAALSALTAMAQAAPQ